MFRLQLCQRDSIAALHVQLCLKQQTRLSNICKRFIYKFSTKGGITADVVVVGETFKSSVALLDVHLANLNCFAAGEEETVERCNFFFRFREGKEMPATNIGNTMVRDVSQVTIRGRSTTSDFRKFCSFHCSEIVRRIKTTILWNVASAFSFQNETSQSRFYAVDVRLTRRRSVVTTSSGLTTQLPGFLYTMIKPSHKTSRQLRHACQSPKLTLISLQSL